MDRSFAIVHISDLHLDGAGTQLSSVQALLSTITERMHKLRDVTDRILLITGDLVNDPTPKALTEARKVIEMFRSTNVFSDIRAIAGNHDVKKLGLFFRRKDAYKWLKLPKTSQSVYYHQSGLNLLLVDSNAASLAKGKIGQYSYDRMVASSADLVTQLKQSIEPKGEREYAEPIENLVRVIALHHHPLPQATGEGKRVFGVPDEPLMYLVSPATFLEAAASLGVNLILHGHRHVEGITRYSIPNRHATKREAADEFWQTVYVLSCPSSTGHGGDDAGFNIVHLRPSYAGRRLQYNFEITRYTRRGNNAFAVLDGNLHEGIIKLPFGSDFYRDPAVQASTEIANINQLKRDRVIMLVRQLLNRRAFYDDIEQSWTHALYTYLVTYQVWEDLVRKFMSASFQRDTQALECIKYQLNLLIKHCGVVLGFIGRELDDLRDKRLINYADAMRVLPTAPRPETDLRAVQDERLKLIREIDRHVNALGIDMGLGGRLPDAALV